MKYFKHFLLVLSVLCLLSVCTHAEEPAVYELDEVGLSIEVPASHYIFTRDMEPDDPVLSQYRTTKGEQLAYMCANDIYLRLVDPSYNYSTVLIVSEADYVIDFNLYDEEALRDMAQTLIPDGCKSISSDIFDHTQAKFIELIYAPKTEDSGHYGIQYITVLNGKFVQIVFTSATGGIPTEAEHMMKDMVNSIIFHDASSPDTAPITYELDKIGLRVDIPANHVVFTTDIDENDPNLAKYQRTKEEQLALMAANNSQLYLWNTWINYDISICQNESDSSDFNEQSDETLLDFAATSLPAIYTNNGLELMSSEVYHHSQTKFLKMTYVPLSPTNWCCGVKYMTYYGGNEYTISLTSYRDTHDEADEVVLQQIVDSVFFHTATSNFNATSTTEAGDSASASGEDVQESEEPRWVPVTEKYELPPTPKKTVVPTGLILTAVGLCVLCVIIAICRHRAKKREEE